MATESPLLSLQISPTLDECLDTASELCGCSKSDLVRRLLTEGLGRLAEPERLSDLRQHDEERLRARLEVEEALLLDTADTPAAAGSSSETASDKTSS